MHRGTERGNRVRSELTHRFAETAREPGKYYDRDGLFLFVKRSANGGLRKTWVQRLTIHGRRRDIGLGRFPSVSLAEARDKAAENLKAARAGEDPRVRARKGVVPTFAEALEREIERRRSGWRTERRERRDGEKDGKTVQSWRTTMRRYALPRLGGMRVDEITTGDVQRVLDPIWNTKRETAIKVIRRIGAVMDTAIVQGFRDDNPVNLRLRSTLPKKRAFEPEHLRALPHAEVAAAIKTVWNSDAMETTKLAFEFLVLTAGRSSEVREATWPEIDVDSAIWTIGKHRTKNGRRHRVPLCARALEILEEAGKHRDGSLVFPGAKRARPLTDSTMSKLCRENGIEGTVHGMRSSFRQWAAECTDFDGEIAEIALSHVNQNIVEATYQRSDLLEKRARLMADWALYLATC